MNITLYKFYGEKDIADKRDYLQVISQLEGTLRETCSIISPIISIEHSLPLQANYAYIQEFQRFYYITDIESVRNDLWRIHLSVDPLTSFIDDLDITGIVERNQIEYNPMLLDNKLNFSNDLDITIINGEDNPFYNGNPEANIVVSWVDGH